jgi:hypothetical protein
MSTIDTEVYFNRDDGQEPLSSKDLLHTLMIEQEVLATSRHRRKTY